MELYKYEITLRNTSYYVANATAGSLLRKIRKESINYNFLESGIVRDGKILYLKSSLTQLQLRTLLDKFANKFEYLQITAVVKGKEEIVIDRASDKEDFSMTRVVRIDLMKDAYHHSRVYPDYGTINEN